MSILVCFFFFLLISFLSSPLLKRRRTDSDFCNLHDNVTTYGDGFATWGACDNAGTGDIASDHRNHVEESAISASSSARAHDDDNDRNAFGGKAYDTAIRSQSDHSVRVDHPIASWFANWDPAASGSKRTMAASTSSRRRRRDATCRPQAPPILHISWRNCRHCGRPSGEKRGRTAVANNSPATSVER